MICKGIVKKRTLKVKIWMSIACLIMLCVEIFMKKYVYIPILTLVILAVFLEKEHLISEKGVDIQYSLFGKVSHYYWKWDEITTLHVDDKKASPNYMIHIGKGIITRSFVMDEQTCKDVLKLARKMNPNIYIHTNLQ